MFDEYKYNPLIQEDQPSQVSENDADPSTMFEISLDTLLECLNIFGTGFSAISQFALENRKKKSWKRESDESGEDRPRRKKGPKGNATLDQYFSSVGGKKTGMRLSYRGAGYPLVLILSVKLFLALCLSLRFPKGRRSFWSYHNMRDSDLGKRSVSRHSF